MVDQIIYIDSDAAPAGDGSIETPYDSPADISAGDWTALNAAAVAEDIAELNFQGTITDLLTIGAGGDSVSGTRIVIQSYGTGVVFDGQGAIDASIDTNGYSYLTFKNLDFTRSLQYGIWNRSNGGRKPQYVTIENCDFYNLKRPIYTYGNTALLAPDNIVIRGCNGWDNSSAFMSSKWVDGVDYYNCSAKDSAIHGFSSQAHMLDDGEITTGWTLESGTIYYRSTDSNAIYKVIQSNSPFIELHESASAFGSIAPGEYKVDSGNLYINIGKDPEGEKIRVAVTVCQNINYYDSWADGITTTGDEGHGFVFDDFSTGSFNRCKTSNCDQDGFVFHASEASTMAFCVSISDGRYGAWLNTAANNIGIYHLTVINSGEDGIRILGDAVDYDFRNNITSGAGGYGLRITSVGTQTGTHDYNYFYNSASGAYSNTTQSANEVIDTDPLLLPDGQLQPGSPAVEKGETIPALTGTFDLWGNTTLDPPNIGADQFYGVRPVQTLSNEFWSKITNPGQSGSCWKKTGGTVVIDHTDQETDFFLPLTNTNITIGKSKRVPLDKDNGNVLGIPADNSIDIFYALAINEDEDNKIATG